jgi:hypothetical protein
MAKKAGKIYGTEREASKTTLITGTNVSATKNTNGSN